MRNQIHLKLFLIFFLLFFEGSNLCITKEACPPLLGSNLLKLRQIKKHNRQKIIIDCNYSLKQALTGEKIPLYIKKNLALVTVRYFSFDRRLHQGQIVINKKLVRDIKIIFQIIKREKFPVKSVIPIVRFHWSDKKSMKDNNTSAFNFRDIKGTKILSMHAFGRAIDINPKLNPQIKHGQFIPQNAVYNPKTPGTLTRNSQVVKAFIKRGWQWGGFWRRDKDYQHFQK